MKRIFFYNLLIVIIASFSQGCSNSDDAYLNVNRSEVIFTDANSQFITIDTNEDWFIQPISSPGTNVWFTVSPTNGSAGEHSISISPIDANTGITERTGSLQINAGGIIRSVELRQNIQGNIALSSRTVEIPPEGGRAVSVTLTINTNWTFALINNITFPLDYVIEPSNSGTPGTYTLTFSAAEANETGSVRTAEFIIYSEGQEYVINISQDPVSENPFYSDRDVITLQQATIGNGVNLLFMGDGFTQQDMERGDGRYEQIMRRAMDHFFAVQPYNSYRNYFNVYMMVAVSPQAGVGDAPGEVNNRFGSYFGEGTLVEFNFNLCKEYALEAFEGSGVQEGDLTVALILNSTRYAGTSTMQSDGFSITRCPMSNLPAPNDFKGIINHELGGHGFARAADEYIYSEQTQVPLNEITEIRMWQDLGAFLNVDFTNNLSNILWEDFIGRPQYTNVGAYEGGLTYGRGVWRPEFNSCMNNNIPYYNAPTRWMAVERITRIAGVPFSFEQFVANDIIEQDLPVAKSGPAVQSAPPLHPPILIK